MRKFNWKALLIVVMAVVMAFALVACNGKDKGGGTNGSDGKIAPTITSAEYFSELWKVVDKVGDEKIEGNIYLSAELELKIGTREYVKVKGSDNKYVVTGFRNEKATPLGIKLQAIIDTKSQEGNGTVLKASLCSGNEELVGLYFALANPDDIYVDFAGQHILFPLHFDITLNEGGEDVNYDNSKLGVLLQRALNKDITFKILNNTTTTTVDALLGAITNDMGEGWTIDNLANAILGAIGLDVDGLLAAVGGDGALAPLVNKLIDPVSKKLSIRKALASDLAETLLSLVARKDGDKYMLIASSGMVTELIGSKICTFAATPYLQVDFEKDGDSFKDGLIVSLDIEGSEYTKIGSNAHPFVEVKIKDLEFGSAEDHTIAFNTEDYTSDAQFEIAESFSADGVKFNGEPLKDIELGAKFKLDLKNKTASNGTQAYAYLKYGDKNIAEASYVGGTLALKLDQSVKIGSLGVDSIFPYFGKQLYEGLKNNLFQGNADNPLLKAIESALYEEGSDHTHLNTDFAGVVVKNLDPIKLYDLALNAIAAQIQKTLPPKAPESASSQSAAETPQQPTKPPEFSSNNISDLLYVVLMQGVKTFGEGKIEISHNDIVKLVGDFVTAMYNLPDANGNNAWTVANIQTKLKDFILSKITPPASYDGTPEQYLERELKEVFTGEDANYIHFAIDGVDFSKKGTKTYLEYLISSLLTNLKADITLDFSGNRGVDWSVEATVAGASVNYKSHITATTNPEEQEDLATKAGITESNAAENGWAYLDASSLFPTEG